MTYREYATMDRLMQGITPAPVEYIAEELGGEKFKTVCDDIYAVLKENELSVEQAEVMLEVVKARLKKMNTFGGYRYCSCEDILEAVKPILKAHDLLLTLSDEPKVLEGWHYIEATAKLESLDERTHLQRTHHLRRHHCPHRLPAAGPDQSGAVCTGQAHPAHREPDRGAAGHRWHHHRCRAGRVVEEQQLHPRSPSGRPDIRQAEGTGKVSRPAQNSHT